MSAENTQDNQPQNEEERILGLHSHLGKAWTSDDFNDELPDFGFGEEAEKEFNKLSTQWKSETQHLSSMHKIVENPNYQEIIAMGEVALPFIFQSLQKSPDHWFYALREITGDNPIKSEDAGNLPKMTQSWLNWAYEKGYLEDSSKE
jgi:hypothetical protein